MTNRQLAEITCGLMTAHLFFGVVILDGFGRELYPFVFLTISTIAIMEAVFVSSYITLRILDWLRNQ